jgi:cell wall-associated NlpC family hydrolase
MRIRAWFLLALVASSSSTALADPAAPALTLWQLEATPEAVSAAPASPLAMATDVPAILDADLADALAAAAADAPAAAETAPAEAPAHRSLRQVLADFAVTLRDIRYRRGGREPTTGFDCSGFVRYVFRHSVGQDLPTDSASQFQAGAKIARGEMKTGDLVFFRTRGKRVSHVGIYLDNGRFIHAPSAGKRVSINSLDETYWAKRFAGAKRPDGLS